LFQKYSSLSDYIFKVERSSSIIVDQGCDSAVENKNHLDFYLVESWMLHAIIWLLLHHHSTSGNGKS